MNDFFVHYFPSMNYCCIQSVYKVSDKYNKQQQEKEFVLLTTWKPIEPLARQRERKLIMDPKNREGLDGAIGKQERPKGVTILLTNIRPLHSSGGANASISHDPVCCLTLVNDHPRWQHILYYQHNLYSFRQIYSLLKLASHESTSETNEKKKK